MHGIDPLALCLGCLGAPKNFSPGSTELAGLGIMHPLCRASLYPVSANAYTPPVPNHASEHSVCGNGCKGSDSKTPVDS